MFLGENFTKAHGAAIILICMGSIMFLSAGKNPDNIEESQDILEKYQTPQSITFIIFSAIFVVYAHFQDSKAKDIFYSR